MWRWIGQGVSWILVFGGALARSDGHWQPDPLTIILGFVISAAIGTPAARRGPNEPPPLPFRWGRWAAPAVLAACGCVVLAGLWVLQLPLFRSPVDIELPQRAAWSRPAHMSQYPSDRLIEADFTLARKVGVPLPALPNRTMDPDKVWELRQRIFLAQPGNAELRDPARFKAWEDGMQQAVDAAAARGEKLDDWEIMRHGLDRM